MEWERAKNRRNCSLLHSAGIGEVDSLKANSGLSQSGSAVAQTRLLPLRNFKYLHVHTKFYSKSSFSKDQGGMKMASINPKEFPNPINVRLSEELVETIRKQALRSERTLSGQLRWLLQRAVQEEDKEQQRP